MNSCDDTLLSVEELKSLCITEKVVTKKLTLNPRKKRDSVCEIICSHIEAPLKVAVDIIFNHKGVAPNCKFCNESLNLHNLPNYRPINYSHKSCSLQNKSDSIDWASAVEKRKNTCLEKYGNETFFDYDSMVVKTRETKKERYGNENYVNSKKAQETKQNKYGDKNYRNDEKIKKTCLEKYGAENPFGSKSIIEKSSDVLNSRHGGRGFQSSTILENIEESNTKKYGVKNAMCNLEISTKSRDSKRRIYFGEEVFLQLTEDLHQLYNKYVEENSLSITRLASSIGLDRNTLSRSFVREGFEILDRKYSCSTSAGENYLYNIIKELAPGIKIIRNTRSIIAPKEIDLWIPSHNLGIEYHGSYWHKESKVGDLHYRKAQLARQNGIKLLQIFDFELIENIDKIIQLIKMNLGIIEHKVAARNCRVELLDTKTAREFCEKNHLQGYAGAKINYGLVDKSEQLVQLLSFARPRFSKSYQWEIIRSCSRYDTIVIGGIEKLWAKFVREQTPDSVISYANARFFDGKSYRKLGFEYYNHSGSGYVWSNGVRRVSRYKTQKNKLPESQGSETDIMKANGFHKLLDAGNHVYQWKN